MKTFVKLLIVQCLTAGGLILAWSSGLLETIFNADRTHISAGILIVFLFFSVFNLFLSIAMKGGSHAEVSNKLAISDWFSRKFTTFGLLGTVIGFSIVLSQNLVETSDTGAIIDALWTGIGPALYTTICGMVANVFLSLQIFIINYDL